MTIIMEFFLLFQIISIHKIHVHWPSPHLMASKNSTENCQLIEDLVFLSLIKFSKCYETTKSPLFNYNNPLLNNNNKLASSSSSSQNWKYQISISNWRRFVSQLSHFFSRWIVCVCIQWRLKTCTNIHDGICAWYTYCVHEILIVKQIIISALRILIIISKVGFRVKFIVLLFANDVSNFSRYSCDRGLRQFGMCTQICVFFVAPSSSSFSSWCCLYCCCCYSCKSLRNACHYC